MNHTHNYCVILAGGVGKRLWPFSTKEQPKQFLDFFGTGRTLLQQTYERVARFLPEENIFISTYSGYLDLVHEQLPAVPASNILPEPVQLSTAPAVAWASYHIALRDPDARVATMPCDQLIIDEARFAEDLKRGLDFVGQNEAFLVMGVSAGKPNTAYGYIQLGEEVGEDRYTVKSFTEKPNEEFAQMFVQSGEFLWNTGLFVWHVETMRRLFHEIMPMVDEALAEQPHLTLSEELDIVQHYYPTNVNRSIDLVILGKAQHVYVQHCRFGWADLGNWPDIREAERKDADGNAVVGESPVLFSASRNNLVCLPEGVAAVVHGLDGYLVALRRGVLVVCPDNDPALVRRLLNEAQFSLGEEYV